MASTTDTASATAKKTTYDDISRLPASLLKVAYLVGKTPFRACRVDQRVSYSLYVPAKQYCVVHEALRKTQVQKTPDSTDSGGAAGIEEGIAKLPLIVSIHGTRRDASQSRDTLVAFADAHGCAILAPLFPAGLDGPTDLDNFKRLRSASLHADTVMLGIISEVAHIWRGIATDRFVMLGWSGGGQFAHRFAYLYPERLAALIIGSPGKTTNIDLNAEWPVGLRDLGQHFDGRELNLEGLKKVKHILMVVGAEDGLIEGAAELKQVLKKVEPEKAATLSNLLPRRDALEQMHTNWKSHGVESDFVVVPGVAHTYLEILPTMLSWLQKVSLFSEA